MAEQCEETETMDSMIVTAMAGVLGSLVGGSATVVTAWITRRTLSKRELIGTEIRRRETLYGAFIHECSKLVVDSLRIQCATRSSCCLI